MLKKTLELLSILKLNEKNGIDIKTHEVKKNGKYCYDHLFGYGDEIIFMKIKKTNELIALIYRRGKNEAKTFIRYYYQADQYMPCWIKEISLEEIGIFLTKFFSSSKEKLISEESGWEFERCSCDSFLSFNPEHEKMLNEVFEK